MSVFKPPKIPVKVKFPAVHHRADFLNFRGKKVSQTARRLVVTKQNRREKKKKKKRDRLNALCWSDASSQRIHGL